MTSVQNQKPRRRNWYSKHARFEVEPDQPAKGRHRRRLPISPLGIDGQSRPSPDAIVFVIDDDEPFRDSLSSLVRSAGLRVEVFASAEEFLRSRHPDVAGVLVLDVHLPGLSGFDLQTRLCEIALEIPIIFITGRGDVPMSVRAMQSGAVTFLVKPFGDEELIPAIRQGIERDRAARQRIVKLTEANEALRDCLDALTETPKVDEILGQVIAATTRQLNASSSALFIRDGESDFVTLEFVFQDNCIRSPAEVNYPENLRTYRLTKRTRELSQQPAVLVHLSRDHTSIEVAHRSYLLGLGVKTVLLIPLTIGKRLVGCLNFRFAEKTDLRPEQIEISRALAAQTSLALQLTTLAKTASQSAVLEERNRLAGEIHDSLAQNFAAIAAQLNLAGEVIGTNAGSGYLDRAKDFARFGLAEARRTALCLHPFVLDQVGLIGTMEMLVDRSNIPGRLRCIFSVNDSRANYLPPETQHHILRIAQEAISNAVRHGNPANISVTLRFDRSHLELRIQNDGHPISAADLLNQNGLGLGNMRNRADKIKATLNLGNREGGGTVLVLKVPING
jgi:two-component system, NarL family, sensor kinase